MTILLGGKKPLGRLFTRKEKKKTDGMSDFAKNRFPAPPRYFLQFADEGVSVRPPNPPPGPYVMFGDTYPPPGMDEVRPLSDSGETLLCPALATLEKDGTSTEVDAVSELKNMTHSIVLSYIQLLDVLANNPANAQEKIDDLDVCFTLSFSHVVGCH